MAELRPSMSDDERLERAREAQRLLQNPLLQEALDAIERGIINVWRGSELVDERHRNFLFLQLKAHDLFVSYLTRALRDGKVVIEQQVREQKLRVQREEAEGRAGG